MAGIRIFLLLLAALAITAGCSTAPAGQNPPVTPVAATATPAVEETGAWEIPADRYVFIDHHVSRSGDVVSGTCSGGMMIDFPMYSFNRETQELSGMSTRDLVINDSLKVVYGDGISLGGALGGGAATGLTAVYDLPLVKNGVTIRSIAPGGLASLAAANATFSLPPGETWTNVTVIETNDFPGGDGTCRVRITRTETIYNGGVVEKSRIVQE